jgi:hypothetical protein
LHPLRASQVLAHFQRHRRVCSLDVATSLNYAVDLRGGPCAVHGLCFEHARKLSFFPLQRFGAGDQVLTVRLERLLDAPHLVFAETQLRDETRVRPPCSRGDDSPNRSAISSPRGWSWTAPPPLCKDGRRHQKRHR